MIAISAAIMIAMIVQRLAYDSPVSQTWYLLVTYEFGFVRRALLGALVALFKPQISYLDVQLIGTTASLMTIGLYVLLFKRTFGFRGDRLHIFAFSFGSPFFFKNFFMLIGFLDVYGCILAIVSFLVPANMISLTLIGAGCVALLLIHHLHFLLYMPTIVFIAIVRFYVLRRHSRAEIALGCLLLSLVCATFVVIILFGSMPVPDAVVLDSMRKRAIDPLGEPGLSMWSSTIRDELTKTANAFPRNAGRIPVFLALVALHWPLIRFGRQLLLAIADRRHRLIALGGIVGISLGYLCIFVVVFDYARWWCGWAICMFLLLHVLALLQSQGGASPPAFSTPQTEKANALFCWVLTLIPRVGMQIPF